MRDYTTNNDCDFLWISDVIRLKRNAKNTFTSVIQKKNKSTKIDILNVTIFGTIVEVKQIGPKAYVYYVDDGTGVIACKHSGEHFEEMLSVIESEHHDILNESVQSIQRLDQTEGADTTADDSVFNDKSIQNDEIDFNKKSQLMALRSIWDDIYDSFAALTVQYNIGDSVFIEGKLYSYFDVNQVYVNSLRLMSFAEEIIKTALKLENGYSVANLEKKSNSENRLSGLLTFDTITQLNHRLLKPQNMESPKGRESSVNEGKVVTPHLESTITFDTFADKP